MLDVKTRTACVSPIVSTKSQNALNGLSASAINAQHTGKRKRNEFSSTEDIGSPFIIYPHSTFQIEKPLRLEPKFMISRLSLPLAFLETDKGNDGLGGNRLFSACIPVLEPQYSESVRSAVLITKSENDSRFYAIERVRNGIYALCTLGAWVDGKDLEKMKIRDSTVTKEKVDRHIPNLGNDWWRAAAIEANAAPNVNLSKKQKISGLEGLCLQLKPPSRETRSAAPVIQEAPSMTSNEQIFTTQSEPKDKVTSQQAPQNAEEILHMIRAQYQETLYMSQTSLAYFAKGPLSRARAYFQGNDSPSANSIQLSEYLRGYILSLPTLDKKYRESLPAIVEGLPEDALSDNENGALIEALQKKSRRSKKYRIGKDGLYPEEEINIAKWWMSRKSSLNIRDLLQGGEDHSKKTRLTLQRVRETQMQIILVLETLALEILAPTQIISQDSQEHVSENQVDSEKKKKPRKAKDLRIFLDLLIDRLCIWQSMNTTEDSSTRNEEVTAPQELKKASNQPLEPNNLQTFCVDVVLPFYGARLPDISTMLCQKFGGPKPASPPRPSLLKAATSHVSFKPGTPLQRQLLQKPRRTLERVLTDERTASRRPPALSRSATDSLLPSLKREVSDTSLSSIPITKVPLHKSRRYNQREVDLSTASQANEAKPKKKLNVEEELRSAIATLKKPNPRMAVKELVEATEKRNAGMHLRKSKVPTRNPLAQGVQVMVTPSNNRHKDVFSGLPPLPQRSTVVPPGLDEIPSSSGLRAISSKPRIRVPNTRNIGQQEPLIEQTPTRGPCKLDRSASFSSSTVSRQPTLNQPFITPTKPKITFQRSISMQGNPLLPPDNVENSMNPMIYKCLNEPPDRVQDTPLKVSSVSQGGLSQVPTSSPRADENGTNIYASLGWDDIDELI